jgi:hypothetical protein
VASWPLQRIETCNDALSAGVAAANARSTADEVRNAAIVSGRFNIAQETSSVAALFRARLPSMLGELELRLKERFAISLSQRARPV